MLRRQKRLMFKSKRGILCLSLMFVNLFVLQAQVTIGMDQAPAKTALLQIKDQEPGTTNQTSTTGGFILPRVILKSITTLEPFLDPTESGYAEQKTLSVGLLVYNVSNTGGLVPGLYLWSGEKWDRLVGATATTYTPTPTDPEPEVPDNIEDPDGLTLSNAYIVAPGQYVDIPVMKAYSVWNQVLDGVDKINTSGTQSVELLWQDVPSLVNSVSILDSSLGAKAKMRIQTNTGVKGNAVIVFKVDDIIRWSWHLWVTDYNPDTNPIEGANGALLMDRNLGASTATAGNIGAHGLLYQWGRKDPFPGVASVSQSTTSHNLYKIDGSLVNLNFTTVSVADNLVNSVLNPLTFYTSSSDWVSTSNYTKSTLWGATKTVYDPCPKGWHVPPSNDDSSPWSDFSAQAFDAGTGVSWGTGKYYPATGYRDHADGTLKEVGTHGNVWSATGISYGTYSMRFWAYNLHNRHYGSERGDGFSVRCIKE